MDKPVKDSLDELIEVERPALTVVSTFQPWAGVFDHSNKKDNPYATADKMLVSLPLTDRLLLAASAQLFQPSRPLPRSSLTTSIFRTALS